MRIAIVGAAGSGKTTLAEDLAREMGAKYIEDKVLAELIEVRGEPSWRGLRDTRIRRSVRVTALENKIKAETEEKKFVSDKSVVDYLAYWLQNQAEFETPGQTEVFLDHVTRHVSRYDCVVFLPCRDDVDYREGRSQDPVHNLKVGGLKRGLLAILNVPVVDAPYTFGEDVPTWIAKWLSPYAERKKAPKKKGAAKKASKKKATKKKATKNTAKKRLARKKAPKNKGAKKVTKKTARKKATKKATRKKAATKKTTRKKAAKKSTRKKRSSR